MDSIQDIWNAEQCPIISEAIFRSGLVKLVELNDSGGTPAGTKRLRRCRETSLMEMQKRDDFATTFYTEMCSVSNERQALQALAGGAGMGGDGFVALLRASRRKLEWLVFLDFSNPFEDISLSGITLSCRNNLGKLWSFSLSDPANIDVLTLEP